MNLTLYEVLGVSASATPEQIKAAYLSLAKKYHPDKNQDEDPWPKRIMPMLSLAKDTLLDAKKRAEYDAKLAQPVPPPQPRPEKKSPVVEALQEMGRGALEEVQAAGREWFAETVSGLADTIRGKGRRK